MGNLYVDFEAKLRHLHEEKGLKELDLNMLNILNILAQNHDECLNKQVDDLFLLASKVCFLKSLQIQKRN
jgi:hypothetical protein